MKLLGSRVYVEGVYEMDFISGAIREQITLLPDSIDHYVDDNNSVRVIEAYVNSLDLSALGFSKPEPHGTGRPMYDPKDLLKLYIYGYMNRVRSSRRLEVETKRNLEVIWLLRKLSPDHKTIARFRHDNSAALKNVFRSFVKLCTRLGLYGKELATVDGSKFRAVNSKDRNFTGKKLQERISRIDARIEAYLHELDDGDQLEEGVPHGKTSGEIAQFVKELSERKERDHSDTASREEEDGQSVEGIPGETPSEKIVQTIKALSERRERYQTYAEEMAQTGESQKSLTDPDSRLMPSNGKMDVCYNVQTVVDGKNKMIAEFEVTNNASDVNQLTPMSEKTKETLETEGFTVIADAGYDSVQDIVTTMNQSVDVHVAKTDFDICVPSDGHTAPEPCSHKAGRCVYYPDRNLVICPMGKVLYPGYYRESKGYGLFYNRRACTRCSCKCTKESRGYRHRVPMPERDFSKEYDESGLSVRQIRITPDKELIRQRKSIAEHPFGTIKRSMDAGYCLTKGLQHVCGEFSLAFLAYNLKRAINILGAKELIESMA
jgi:transposase